MPTSQPATPPSRPPARAPVAAPAAASVPVSSASLPDGVPIAGQDADVVRHEARVAQRVDRILRVISVIEDRHDCVATLHHRPPIWPHRGRARRGLRPRYHAPQARTGPMRPDSGTCFNPTRTVTGSSHANDTVMRWRSGRRQGDGIPGLGIRAEGALQMRDREPRARLDLDGASPGSAGLARFVVGSRHPRAHRPATG